MPGGFGMDGTLGKIQAISWARTKKIPFLGKTSIFYSNSSALDFEDHGGVTIHKTC